MDYTSLKVLKPASESLACSICFEAIKLEEDIIETYCD